MIERSKRDLFIFDSNVFSKRVGSHRYVNNRFISKELHRRNDMLMVLLPNHQRIINNQCFEHLIFLYLMLQQLLWLLISRVNSRPQSIKILWINRLDNLNSIFISSSSLDVNIRNLVQLSQKFI